MQITEKQLQANVEDTCKKLGWQYYHPWQSIHSVAGYPDLTIVKGSKLIFAELKAEGKQPTDRQQEWLESLARVTSVEVYLWHPEDFAEIISILR